MIQKLRDRYRYSTILLKQLIKTDFKLRYQNSVLGYLWSLLRPLALFAILYFIFVKFLKIGTDIPDFPVYLLLGIVFWNFFAEVTTMSVSAIVSKGEIMRKINFPRYVIVLAGTFAAFINLLLNLLVVAGFMIANKVEIQASAIFAPLLILELFMFALAAAFFLSAAFVRYRDVSYIWEVIMQGAFYATPILYPLSQIPVREAKILMLNPVAQIIQDLRQMLVTSETTTIAELYGSRWIRFVPMAIATLCLVSAMLYFRKRSKSFAEDV